MTNKIFRSRPLYACKLSDTDNVRRDLFILRSYASLIKAFVYEDGRILTLRECLFQNFTPQYAKATLNMRRYRLIQLIKTGM